jgi:hypothetical protein
VHELLGRGEALAKAVGEDGYQLEAEERLAASSESGSRAMPS